MTLSLWQRIYWYIKPPTLDMILEVVAQTQIKLQQSLTQFEKQFAGKEWSKSPPLRDQVEAITQQVSAYDKKAWPIRFWWWIRGKHQDIPLKRSWLFYQACQPLRMHRLDVEAPIIPVTSAQVKDILNRPFLLSSWRISLNNILEGMAYLKQWRRKQKGVKMISHVGNKNNSFVKDLSSKARHYAVVFK